MGSIIIGVLVLTLLVIAVAKFLDPSKSKKKLKSGMYLNRNGGRSVFVDDLLNSPNFKQQLDGFQRIYMRETIMALWEGTSPPNQLGGYGVLTKKKLIIEWNDDWQAEMDELEESYDINYNLFFNIQEEHPEVTIFLTADEIVRSYGS